MTDHEDPGAALSGLVDVTALTRWLDGQGFAGGPVEGLVPLAGGTQNLLVRFSGDVTWLALAQPDRSVVVITGDGEQLMGIGALASVAACAPCLSSSRIRG